MSYDYDFSNCDVLILLDFVFPGLEEEGFEMLEELAYLYLANNRVSEAQVCVMSILLSVSYTTLWQLRQLAVIPLGGDSLTKLTGRGGRLLSHTLCELMLVIPSSTAVPAGPS